MVWFSELWIELQTWKLKSQCVRGSVSALGVLQADSPEDMHSWIKEIGAAVQALKCHPRVSHFLPAHSHCQPCDELSRVGGFWWCRQAARSPDAAEAPSCLVCFSLSTDLGTNFYFCSVVGGGEVELDRKPGLLMCPTHLPARQSLTPAEWMLPLDIVDLCGHVSLGLWGGDPGRRASSWAFGMNIVRKPFTFLFFPLSLLFSTGDVLFSVHFFDPPRKLQPLRGAQLYLVQRAGAWGGEKDPLQSPLPGLLLAALDTRPPGWGKAASHRRDCWGLFVHASTWGEQYVCGAAQLPDKTPIGTPAPQGEAICVQPRWRKSTDLWCVMRRGAGQGGGGLS